MILMRKGTVVMIVAAVSCLFIVCNNLKSAFVAKDYLPLTATLEGRYLAQARELGLVVNQVPQDELVIVRGDCNAAP